MNHNKFFSFSAIALTMLSGAILGGCNAESPFDGDGEGVLKLQMVVNSNVTRAVENEDELRSNCVVYISNDKGLLHKFKGIENVPSELHLKSGSYVAEAWTGDSVGASFDKKFFRGYEPFDINTGVTSVVVTCHIANVVASINHATIDPEQMKDWKVTVGHSRATLDLTEENQSEKGYFMMPSVDTDLTYTVSGTRADGKPFTKTGTIPNVQRAHEYVMNFTYTPDNTQIGGTVITIVIDDKPVEEVSDVPIYGRPILDGESFDIENQVYAEPGQFSENIVKVSAFGGLRRLSLSSDDWQSIGFPAASLDLVNLTASPTSQLNSLGITWDSTHNSEKNKTIAFIHFGDNFLNSLPKRDTEYQFNLEAEDIYGKVGSAILRVAVGEDAVIIADPVTGEEVDPSNPMQVLSKSATLYATINDENALNPVIEYSPADSENWQSVQLTTRSLRRAPGTRMKAVISGLTPATRYQYRVKTDDFIGKTMYFTTESTFSIPNASLEQWSNWSENSKVVIPGADGTRNFWDSGNHGSSTMGVTLTNSSTDMIHSGSVSAKLRSQFVGLGGLVGKFAAGNLFAGTYKETKGTNGVIEFGQEYDGSHPTALSLWANYRPGTEFKGKGHDDLTSTSGDFAQIYVAFTLGSVTVDTSDTKTLFDPEADYVLGYGQVTWNGNFGPDGALEQLSIPVTWRDRANSVRPTHIMIVCSASKYGDFFTGYEGSTMYVDDFELVY